MKEELSHLSLRTSHSLPAIDGEELGMAMSLLSVPPTSCRNPLFSRPSSSITSNFIKFPVIKRTANLSSSSSSVVEDDDPTPSGELPFRGCAGCGKEQVERGCNGEGRMQGGIATVPGFGWWPIKAYRPCPGFLASGGRYKRQGQSMDEVAFGRPERLSSSSTNESQSKKGRSNKVKS